MMTKLPTCSSQANNLCRPRCRSQQPAHRGPTVFCCTLAHRKPLTTYQMAYSKQQNPGKRERQGRQHLTPNLWLSENLLGKSSKNAKFEAKKPHFEKT